MSTVDISQLEPEQIVQFRKQFQEEIDHFTTSLDALNMALSKYHDCLQNIQKISKKEQENKDILVSLSPSLYVPGKIKNNDKFLVDVGTGYYIEKSAEDASTFYQNKINQLKQDYSKVTQIINEKSQTLARMDEILKQKVVQQQQQAKQPAPVTA